jgi:hypothetical protein
MTELENHNTISIGDGRWNSSRAARTQLGFIGLST